MNKYIKFLVIAFFVTIFCSGCNGDITRAIRHDGFTVGTTEFKCDALMDSGSYETVRFFTSNGLITDTGRIYNISLSQKFSNNSNCSAADISVKAVAIFDNKVFKADDGRMYYLVSDNNAQAFSQVTTADNSYYLYDLLLRPEGTVKVMTADSTNGIYYVLKTDGNVYGYTVSSADRNSSPTIAGTVIVYSKDDFGGNIIDFNYLGDSAATYVRSENTVFRMVATNSSECTKYADVKCDYAMMEAEVFSKYGDSIFAYNGSTLITTYGKVFTAATTN